MFSLVFASVHCRILRHVWLGPDWNGLWICAAHATGVCGARTIPSADHVKARSALLRECAVQVRLGLTSRFYLRIVVFLYLGFPMWSSGPKDGGHHFTKLRLVCLRKK